MNYRLNQVLKTLPNLLSKKHFT